MARKRWAWLRHPRTTQELRANQDRNDPLVRGKRRNIPTAWDDNHIRSQKSWKYLGRKHQYRDADERYNWHKIEYHWRDVEKRQVAHNILDRVKAGGFYHKYTGYGILWYGPAWGFNSICPLCHTELISDTLSPQYGDWCPNDECINGE